MISISAKRKRSSSRNRNAPTPERLAKADAPVKTRGRYQAPPEPASSPLMDGPIVDPLKHWRARDVITEEQHRAGRRFQKLFEKAALGADGQARADAAGPRKDLACTPPTPVATLARSELTALEPLLGALDFRLMCNVLGRGKDMAAEAPAMGDGKAYVARRIRDALNLLVMRDAG